MLGNCFAVFLSCASSGAVYGPAVSIPCQSRRSHLGTWHLGPQAVSDLLLASINVLTLLSLVGIISEHIGLVEGVLRGLLELLVQHIVHLVLSQSGVLLLENRHLTVQVSSESSLDSPCKKYVRTIL